MKDETKCNCQHCSGHISFPVEMAGQTISCPHCQLETMLFIPSADTNAPQFAPAKKGISLVWWIFGGAALAFLLLFSFLGGFAFLQRSPGKNEQVSELSLPNQTNQTPANPTQKSPEQTNLESVVGALGWKLGDFLPNTFQVATNDDIYGITYNFDPPAEIARRSGFVLSNMPHATVKYRSSHRMRDFRNMA
jgi:hypothetical protein